MFSNSAVRSQAIESCDGENIFFFNLAQQPPVGQDLLIHKVSRSHSTTHHSR